jgi:RNA polymerase sigma factor (sigma-70 family)
MTQRGRSDDPPLSEGPGDGGPAQPRVEKKFGDSASKREAPASPTTMELAVVPLPRSDDPGGSQAAAVAVPSQLELAGLELRQPAGSSHEREPDPEKHDGRRVGRGHRALSSPSAVGDESAFSDLYRDLHDPLVRLAVALTGSRESAEDIVQDSFVRLHRHFTRVDLPGAYVRRIVVNGCASHHRRRGRERDQFVRLRVVEGERDSYPGELADVLLELPHRQRAAIVLRFYAQMNEAEIAEVLGCRPGTVGSLIHRGLARLRAQVER